MKGKLLVSFFIFISIVMLLTSCVPPSIVSKKITIESGEIPVSMKGLQNYTIVGIKKGKTRRDKKLEKEFKKYKGNYVLLTKTEMLKNSTDEEYRYFLDFEIRNISRMRPDGLGYMMPTTIPTPYYYIVDRYSRKKYGRVSGSHYHGLEIRAYIHALNRILEENMN